MSNWIDVAAEADLFDGAGIAVTPCGRDIALFLVEGRVFATDNQCTHGPAKLCDGYIEGLEVECPFHQGRFDLRTGAATLEPASRPIRVWPVKVEAGRVLLDLG